MLQILNTNNRSFIKEMRMFKMFFQTEFSLNDLSLYIQIWIEFLNEPHHINMKL